jgi:hypothetical protein
VACGQDLMAHPLATCVLLLLVVMKVTSFSNTLLSSLIRLFYKNKIEKVVTFVTFPGRSLGILIQEQHQ